MRDHVIGRLRSAVNPGPQTMTVSAEDTITKTEKRSRKKSIEVPLS